jgi:hypothetical protein
MACCFTAAESRIRLLALARSSGADRAAGRKTCLSLEWLMFSNHSDDGAPALGSVA